MLTETCLCGSVACEVSYSDNATILIIPPGPFVAQQFESVLAVIRDNRPGCRALRAHSELGRSNLAVEVFRALP